LKGTKELTPSAFDCHADGEVVAASLHTVSKEVGLVFESGVTDYTLGRVFEAVREMSGLVGSHGTRISTRRGFRESLWVYYLVCSEGERQWI